MVLPLPTPSKTEPSPAPLFPYKSAKKKDIFQRIQPTLLHPDQDFDGTFFVNTEEFQPFLTIRDEPVAAGP
jgi:hypothetical protein